PRGADGGRLRTGASRPPPRPETPPPGLLRRARQRRRPHLERPRRLLHQPGRGLAAHLHPPQLGAPLSESTALMATGLPRLIPRRALFADPSGWLPQLAPDGAHVAWIAPGEGGASQVWLRAAGGGDERALTAFPSGAIQDLRW